MTRTTEGGGAELTARLQRRDVSALAELYDRMSRRAFGLAYRVLGDGDAAEDVVQEAFIWAWEHAERIDPARGRVESLLLTIVHRRAIDVLRANRRGARIEPFPERFEAEQPAEMDDSEAFERHLAAALRELDALPDEQREALVQAYLDGLTQQEIADRSGIPLGTVKSRLRLGLDKLRRALQAQPRAP